jgi:SAM-dependent methyltransferase
LPEEASVSDPHGERIRAAELDLVLPAMKPGQRVLEIGAGAGWQARRMAEAGLEVIAVDIVGSRYADVRVWPVILYDGVNLPFCAGSFDVVFSSNVLEHVVQPEALQAEIHRVIRPDGYAIHLMPTASWRFWHSLTHYIILVRKLWRRLGRAKQSAGADRSSGDGKRPNWRTALWAPPHGAQGTVLEELLTFRPAWWRAFLVRTGWRVEKSYPNGLFFTGNRVLGERLGLDARRRLSRVLGSSGQVYVVSPRNER